MNHIIVDLEFNCPYISIYGNTIKNDDCPFEIIEIGAVKLDDKFEQIDTFRIFIKLSYYKKVSPIVCKKTGITKEDLKYGFDFYKAVDIFIKWLGENYNLYTWSDNDYRVMKQNCEYYNVACDWFENFIDLQQKYKIYTNDTNVRGLEKVINCLRIPSTKASHTGLNDALYTAEILKYLNEIPIKRISENNRKKESDKNNCNQMLCPICGEYVEKECESNGFNMKERHNILGICNKCNVPIVHIVECKEYDNDLKYFVETEIVKMNTYNNLKRSIMKNTTK